MRTRLKRNTLALLVGAALALPAAAVHAEQQNRQQQGQQPQRAQDLSRWDARNLYQEGWSAEEMLGTDVRGPDGEEIGEVKDIFVGGDGKISRVVVEVGGFLEIGDQHIGVPFEDVTVGQDMEFVQVPLKEVEDGTYSLYGKVPEGEDVPARQEEWRVNELIGDFASLDDVRRYGRVNDVIFDQDGQAQGVIVSRAAGTWGAAGWYGYPWHGYDRTAATHAMPYRSADVGDYGRFDYVAFAEQSKYAGEESADRTQARAAGDQDPQTRAPGDNAGS